MLNLIKFALSISCSICNNSMEDKENFNSFLHNFSNIVNIDNSTYQTNQTSQKHLNFYGQDAENQDNPENHDFLNLQVRLQMTEKDLQETKQQLNNESRQRNETYLTNIERLGQKHNDEVTRIRIEYENKIDSLIVRHSNEKRELVEEIDLLKKQIDCLNSDISKFKAARKHREVDLVQYQRNYIKELDCIMGDIGRYKLSTMKEYDELYCKYRELKDSVKDGKAEGQVIGLSGVDVTRLEEQYRQLMPSIEILEIELKAARKENIELRKEIMLLEERLCSSQCEGIQKLTCRSNGVTLERTTAVNSNETKEKIGSRKKQLKPSLSELKISNSHLFKELSKISKIEPEIKLSSNGIKEISGGKIFSLVKGLKEKPKGENKVIPDLPLQMNKKISKV